jgi:hypothetical protein
MDIFGQVAVEATKYAIEKDISPVDAWREVIETKNVSESTKIKGCPRSAYLGLCQEGYVKDINCGDFTKSIKNKIYAINAVKNIPPSEPIPAKSELWKIATNGELVAHNGQMNVVIALWKNGLINIEKTMRKR